MAKRDYYEVLGVARTATEVEVNKAYRRLAMQHHPDRNVGDPEAEVRFKEVTEAYEVLKDAQRRQVYDRYGHDGLAQAAAGGGVDLGDILSQVFGGAFAGGRRRPRAPRRGEDIEDILDVDLLEAATGVKRTVSVRYEANCRGCGGTGAKPGTHPAPCRRCKGTGGETASLGGMFSFAQACRGCGGRGVVVTDPCPACRGVGRVETRESIDVPVPPGVDTRVRLTVPGRGHEGPPGAARGDLELVVRVREHKVFERDGHNLICQFPVSFARAALGGPVEIPTLTGQKVTAEVPRGAQTHTTVLRVPGHGMPDLDDPRRKGDLLVQLVVETPAALSAEQEELFRRLAELDGVTPPAPRKGLFGKLKDLISGDAPPTEQR
ncbi:MAG: molecular chaperone DnaJ [Isosphaera sp.]|nr:molecular chaperone DnaJ [Isosphaera sp.]